MDTTHGIGDALVSRFGKLGGTQLYSVKKHISTLAQGINTFPVYFTEMKSIWDELANLCSYPI